MMGVNLYHLVKAQLFAETEIESPDQIFSYGPLSDLFSKAYLKRC